jgi:DNA-binding NarL/FixJ family response regulator
MIRILIADDHVIVREGLKRIIEASGGMQVVAEASTGQEALEKAKVTHPEVVLLDVSMPGRGGLETAQELKKRDPRTRVLMLTVHPEDHFAVRCLKEGADGYLTKEVASEQLVQAIHKVYGGGKYVSPSLAERLAFSLDSGFGRAPHEALSDREFEVLRRIGAGKTVGEIASELNLSVKTISTYRARLLEKMNMKNNAEIMRYVVDQGLAE